MGSFIKEFDPVLASGALVGFTSANVVVVFEVREADNFGTKVAGLWLQGAPVIVVAVFEFRGFELAVGAGNESVFFLFVLFFFGLWDALIALLAPVVLARTADVVHSKLADFDVLVAQWALLRFFLRFHFNELLFRI